MQVFFRGRNTAVAEAISDIDQRIKRSTLSGHQRFQGVCRVGMTQDVGMAGERQLQSVQLIVERGSNAPGVALGGYKEGFWVCPMFSDRFVTFVSPLVLISWGSSSTTTGLRAENDWEADM